LIVALSRTSCQDCA